jgi:GNAT superfamily N-acetyltransferase
VYASTRISEAYMLEGFDCGQPSLNRWLSSAALTSDRMGSARTYLWTEEPAMAVVAYFSLCPHEVRRDDVPTSLTRGAPRAIPAILLARLALDLRLHGQGLGSALLLDALDRAAAAVEIAGGRLIVVDAIDEPARRFYEHHGFRALPSRPARLFRKASDVMTAIGQVH